MAYYTTTTLAARHGLSVPACRWHLQQGGHQPRITRLTTPRGHTVHSWDDAAAAYLKKRLATRTQPSPPPNPIRWVPLAQGRAQAGISRAHLYRLISSGAVRSRRHLQQTPKGARWITYLSLADLANLTPSNPPQKNMPNAIVSALRRSWLLLLAAEQQTENRLLGAYVEGAKIILLSNPTTGETHQLPITNPESSPTIPATYTGTPPADQWAAVAAAFSSACATQHQNPGSILSFDAATVDIWSRGDKEHLATYPLPH